MPPLNNIDMSVMSKQLEGLFKDLSSNLKIENIEGMEDFNPDDMEEYDDEEGEENGGNPLGIPIGSIFASIVPGRKVNGEEEANGSGRQKVKVEKKPANKKKKYLDTYGTNLTQKAKNNELDMVIGRDKEIQRVIQILNRRTKNNPCLIGEPGVGKTAIAQGLAIKIANNNQIQNSVPVRTVVNREKNETNTKTSTKPVANKVTKQFSTESSKYWPEIVNDLKANGKIVLYTNLMNTKAVELNDMTVGIEFPNGITSFGKTVLEKPENVREISNLVSMACGKPMNIKYIPNGNTARQITNEDALQNLANDSDIPFNIIE